MALISNTNPGRTDGGYTRVLGHKQLGSLISRVQATTIAAGKELERLLPEHATTFKPEDITALIHGTLPVDNYLVTRQSIRTHFKPLIGSDKEPDFLVISVAERAIYVVEVKDGDCFDTKKARGEVRALNEFSQRLKQWMCREIAIADYVVDMRMCFFNAPDRDQVAFGMKGFLPRSKAWTGQDLCRVLDISFDAIASKRTHDAEENLDYFLGELAAIPDLRERLLKALAGGKGGQ